jgi:MFS family permease
MSMPFAARFVRKTSSRMNCVIAGVAMTCCMYMASYCVTFKSFALIYGLFNGIIIGIIYIVPIAHCYQFFPNKRSSISIIIVAASGIGTLLFAFIGYNVMNFNNESVSSSIDGFYGMNIANKFP